MTDLDSLHREKARLRKIGVIVLLAGLCCAGLVYWIGSRPDDPNLAEYYQAEARAESRQMQMLYGTSGGIANDFYNSLKRPRTQAGIIIVAAGIIAAGCFYLGRPLEDNDEAG